MLMGYYRMANVVGSGLVPDKRVLSPTCPFI